MSVRREAQRFIIALSSDELEELNARLAAGKPMEFYGLDVVIEIERRQMYWNPKKKAKP